MQIYVKKDEVNRIQSISTTVFNQQTLLTLWQLLSTTRETFQCIQMFYSRS